MIKDILHGFSMALADSVPGVSGGTVAFIMGFYDRFIGSINALTFGNKDAKIKALKYLMKLGVGWGIGMILAVLILSALFESHIYNVSSLFMGFILGAIPIIVMEEKGNLKNNPASLIFFGIGLAIVVGIGFLGNIGDSASFSLGEFTLSQSIRLFFLGMIAISAMFLPGISGSTFLLIFGAYIPIITGIREVLGLDFSYIPSLFVFGVGVLIGAQSVVKVIEYCLRNYRSRTIFFVLGMMFGSIYPIILGPTTLENPVPALSLGTFSPIFFIGGVLLVLGMQWIKLKEDTKAE
ncbi:DUF368 domain-containing protein [Peptoniphilus sp. KCTC 25270]|uniref:DUF368 domain-containing protein n=1 Tax=Peptoniphilus sp. KCTC 25270 TaxID=2897414 RepID=UPI001E3771E0|nr:DUF368 domain-containing protein [Peptoniphilus sp. KCTC 25270]MCD1147492.1 DUF368 domain-containing protein [Peptoniphilus sp. KCTC 25270]